MAEDTLSSNDHNIVELLDAFKGASDRKRRSFLPILEQRVDELLELGSSVMSPFSSDGNDWAAGFLLQLIHKRNANFNFVSILPSGFKIANSVTKSVNVTGSFGFLFFKREQ